MDELCNGNLNGAHPIGCRCQGCDQLESENPEYREYRRYLESIVCEQQQYLNKFRKPLTSL